MEETKKTADAQNAQSPEIQPESGAQPSLEEMCAASLGAPPTNAPGVVWMDNPANITNRFGEWQYGVPRYHLTDDDIATLGPGFAPASTPRSAKDKH